MKKEKKENIWLGRPHADTTKIFNIRLPRDRLRKKNYILQDNRFKSEEFWYNFAFNFQQVYFNITFTLLTEWHKNVRDLGESFSFKLKESMG